jgi:hypothetical protein
MWARAHRYQKLIEWGQPKLKKFGWKRYVLFWIFNKVDTRLQRYENARFTYVSLALSLSRKIRIRKIEQQKQRLDH